jgi:large subunit ribosomal protein L10
MALTRTKKNELLSDYESGFSEAPHAFLLGFQGISVPQVTELRSQVRKHGGSYLVVKNTLALRATDGKALAELKEQFEGPTAVAYTDGDAVSLAKALTDFAKDVPAVVFKGGVVDSHPVAAEDIKEIAGLPSREELLAKLLFLMQSPVTRLARGLNAITRDFVVVLDQVRQQKEA